MSARTAAQHTADELTYHGIRGEVAVFSARSARKPGQRNVIVRDGATGEFHCDCTAADTGKRCWHTDRPEAAWRMRLVAPCISTLADDELLVWPQARVVWRQRAAHAPARAPLAALPAAERGAIVALAA